MKHASINLIIFIIAAITFVKAQTGGEMTDSLGVFPSVSFDNLEGKTFNLPQDFKGNVNLVLIAFQREQQRDIETWFSVGDSLEQEFEEFAFYEIPTISRLNPVSRWFINTGMRAGINDETTRRRTITLYLDKESFTDSLHIESQDTIHPMLITPQGRVLWRTRGAMTPDSKQELLEFVEQHFREEQ